MCAREEESPLPVCAAGRPHPADPVLPRLPQGPQPAHLPQPGGPLGAHQPAPPHGGGEEAQTQLLTGAGLSGRRTRPQRTMTLIRLIT